MVRRRRSPVMHMTFLYILVSNFYWITVKSEDYKLQISNLRNFTQHENEIIAEHNRNVWNEQSEMFNSTVKEGPAEQKENQALETDPNYFVPKQRNRIMQHGSLKNRLKSQVSDRQGPGQPYSRQTAPPISANSPFSFQSNLNFATRPSSKAQIVNVGLGSPVEKKFDAAPGRFNGQINNGFPFGHCASGQPAVGFCNSRPCGIAGYNCEIATKKCCKSNTHSGTNNNVAANVDLTTLYNSPISLPAITKSAQYMSTVGSANNKYPEYNKIHGGSYKPPLGTYRSPIANVVGPFLCPVETDPTGNKGSRGGVYPNSQVQRFDVPDDKVLWTIYWPEYSPVDYTETWVLAHPDKADPLIGAGSFAPKFNSIDGNVNRQSYTGVYTVVNGIPRNPIGRTGMTGRGFFRRWGPNHGVDTIITRWKRIVGSNQIERHPKTGKPVLNFIAVQRKDNGKWSTTGGVVEPGEQAVQALKREFVEEALDRFSGLSANERARVEAQLDRLLSNGVCVFAGYSDGPRNTDNAWFEMVVVNFHDEQGSLAGTLPLKAGSDAAGVAWINLDSRIEFSAFQLKMLSLVADLHGAHW